MEFLPGHPHHILAIGVDGRVFHFCSDACRQKFQADPDRYVIGRVGQPEDFAEAAEIDGAEGQGS